MTDILLYAFFEDSTNLDGETGLSPIIDIRTIAKADLTNILIVNSGSMTEIGDGLYGYRQASGDLDTNDYIAVAKTTSGDVVSKYVPALRWDGAEQWSTQLERLDTSVSGTASSVWSVSTRTLTSFGTLVADVAAAVWAYTTRTLTQTLSSIISSVTSTKITQTRGDTWAIAVTLGVDVEGKKIQFAIKTDKSKTDAESAIFIDTDTGLLIINEADATAPQNSLGSISVTATGTGAIIINLDESISATLESLDDYKYGIQTIISGTVAESWGANFVLSEDVVRAVT